MTTNIGSNKTILVAPLDWGLGHATRCVPIIKHLLANNNKVIIAGDYSTNEVLRKEFPQLTFLFLKGFRVKYTKYPFFNLFILLQLPRLFLRIITEHIELKKILQTYAIDIVISDNRYGLWNNNAYSIFITHQLFIQVPFFQKIIQRINFFFIHKYNECWIPDEAGSTNYSGILSHGNIVPSNAKYIGILSRFSPNTKHTEKKYDILVLLSGLEPQRSLLENKVVIQLQNLEKKVLLIQGISTKERAVAIQKNNISTVPYLPSNELEEAILSSEVIICRSGYSTIMDLITLNKKAILIPTPGQTEQEYLAEYLSKKYAFTTQQQNSLDLTKEIR